MRLAIGSRRMLFLLDDLWENEVFAYLAGGAQCRYVFTTRSPRLALAQSHAVYRIPELSDEEALTLLTRSLPPPFPQTYRRQMEQLVQQVGKLPLALVLLGELKPGPPRPGILRKLSADSPRTPYSSRSPAPRIFTLTSPALYLRL